MHWSGNGLSNILALRTTILSGRYEDFCATSEPSSMPHDAEIRRAPSESAFIHNHRKSILKTKNVGICLSLSAERNGIYFPGYAVDSSNHILLRVFQGNSYCGLWLLELTAYANLFLVGVLMLSNLKCLIILSGQQVNTGIRGA